MGKVLQPKAKRSSGPAAKKSVKRAAPRATAKKAPAKPTLRQLNAWLTRNHEQLVGKAKENTRRLIGRETL